MGDSGGTKPDPFDPEHLKYEVVYDPVMAERKAKREKRRANRFVKGPISFDTIVRATRCHPRGLSMFLVIKMAVDRSRTEIVTLPTAELDDLGIVERKTRYRILAALEGANLIQVERRTGRLPRVALVVDPDRSPETEATILERSDDDGSA